MTKKQALKIFNDADWASSDYSTMVIAYLSFAYRKERKRVAWKNWTKSLQTQGIITKKQFNSWVNPF